MRKSLLLLGITIGVISGSGVARAQNGPGTVGRPERETVTDANGASTPEEVIVEGVPPEASILPTIRPISSAYGTDMNILDTPRDISTITKEQVDFRQITSVTQLGQFASGTYSSSRFGAEGLPQIRGVTAEIYQNGQRLHHFNNSFPPSFNGVESIDIVKGPGTAVYGVAQEGLGGYVNLVTKQPYFDKQHTEITGIIGDFYEGGQSYGRYQWTLDNSGPLIKDKLAYRVSYLGRESSSYYRNLSDNVQDIFGALTYTPTTNLRFDLTSQYYESKFNENAGFNRVTQDLIDNHEYISGPLIQSYAPFVGVVDPGPDGSYDDQKVKLHNSEVLVHPGDSAAGSRFIGQLITTLTLPGLTVKNSTFGDTTETRKFSTYGFTEYNPSTVSIENRTEFQFNLDTPITDGRDIPALGGGKDGKDKNPTHEDGILFKHHFDMGVSFRYEHTRGYSAFINEPFSVYDISGNGPSPVFDRATLYGPERTIPEKAGYYGSDLFGQAIVSNFYQGGIFLQDAVDFTSYLSGIFGFRVDIIGAESGAPNLGPLVDPAQDFGGPGDPAAAIPATSRDLTLIANEAYFASLVYKPIKQVSLYLTYDRVNGIASANNTGALPFVRRSDPFETRVAAGDLRQLSELYEGGIKLSLFKDTLFVSGSGYHQNRSTLGMRGDRAAIVARGADVDVVYQPNKNLSVTANFAFQENNYKASAPFSETNNYLDMFAEGVNVDGNAGTGLGSPNYGVLPKGDYRLPDIPRILFNAYAIYKFDFGLGIGLGPQVTGPVNVNTQGTLVIPAQVTLNGFIFYAQKNYELRLSFFNITDERNWTPPDVFANNDLIFPDPPFHMNATVKLRF